CGPSGLVVIDLDIPPDDEPPPGPWNLPGVREGADVLALLCERQGHPFPAGTFTVRTRRGGMHLYFTPPPGLRLTNTTGGSPRSLGWHIDTRAHGGYVVAPGSYVDLPDGTGPYDVTNDQPPAPLPDWLAGLLNLANRPSPPMGGSTPPGQVTDLSAYARAALQSGAERVAVAARGGRNHALNKAAYSLGQLVGAQILPEALVAAALYEAASVHFGPTKNDMSPSEARTTIRSGLSDGIRNPRTLNRRSAA
ncbi:MAG: hypothetical protein JWL97_4298, partial [Gemmatimonadales bacterium]|nr:hypothetical protein [Gemmatimonadales bacterium]